VVTYAWVALGSALGGVARFGCTGLAARYISDTYPWGTLLVNVTGSLAIGILAALVPESGRLFFAPDARALFMIGICGGFTTFSSFSLETLNLARNGEWFWAGSYIVLSLVLCLAAVALGYFGVSAFQTRS
jgi:CrcB protein